MNKHHPAFWKCDFDFDCDHNCNTVNFATDELCRRCNTPRYADDDAPLASNKEVLVAWLEADDDRRKELELASRPTKAGYYQAYKIHGYGGLPEVLAGGYITHPFDHYGAALWIPIEEN